MFSCTHSTLSLLCPFLPSSSPVPVITGSVEGILFLTVTCQSADFSCIFESACCRPAGHLWLPVQHSADQTSLIELLALILNLFNIFSLSLSHPPSVPPLPLLLLLPPVGIRVLHPVLGESGIPAQHCQKVHRPEVCPTGECLSRHAGQTSPASSFCHGSCFSLPAASSVSLCFHLPFSLILTSCLSVCVPSPPSSSWSCLTARILGRETTWRQSCIESTANSWGWGLLYENRSIIFFYGELTLVLQISNIHVCQGALCHTDLTIFLSS